MMNLPDRADKLDVEAVLFDLDGTLIDTVDIYYRIVHAVLERLDLPEVSTGMIRDAGEGGQFDWHQVLPAGLGDKKTDLIDVIWQIVEEIAPRMFADGTKMIPGAKEVLTRISQKGLSAGIVTSTPLKNLHFKLKVLQDERCDHMVQEIIGLEAGLQRKPAPDHLFLCCRRLGVTPRKSIFAGDTRVDIQAGQAA